MLSVLCLEDAKEFEELNGLISQEGYNGKTGNPCDYLPQPWVSVNLSQWQKKLRSLPSCLFYQKINLKLFSCCSSVSPFRQGRGTFPELQWLEVHLAPESAPVNPELGWRRRAVPTESQATLPPGIARAPRGSPFLGSDYYHEQCGAIHSSKKGSSGG